MFWEKWIPQKYLIKSSVCSLEAVLGDNGTLFYGCIVKNQNNQLSLASGFSSEQKPELPAEVKKNKLPVMLCVTGRGVINKKISLPEEQQLSLAEILAQHLPTVQADEFYVQLHPQENNYAYLAVIRKIQLDNLLEYFSSHHYEVADVLIGPAFISGVAPITSTFTRLQTTAYAIELANNSVESVADNGSETGADTETYNAGGLLLNRHTVLPFGAAYLYLTNGFEQHTSDAQLEGYHQRHLQGNKLRVLSYFFISLAFLFCLVNFFTFNHYFGASKKLETELSIYQGKYDQINELLSNYEKQKGLIEQAGILNNSAISKFSDKIAATIPNEVVLTDWTFNPQKEDTEEDSLTSFTPNVIIIKGNCNKSLIVNEWLNVLKSQNFIRDINLEKFAFNSEGNQPNFELKIVTD